MHFQLDADTATYRDGVRVHLQDVMTPEFEERIYRSGVAHDDETSGELVVVCHAAAVDPFLEFGAHHVLQVGADSVTVGRGIRVELKMHVCTPICRHARLRMLGDNATLNSESNHIRRRQD
jgi:hypothetical protein